MAQRPVVIRGLGVRDIRFPTTLDKDGSDAVVSILVDGECTLYFFVITDSRYLCTLHYQSILHNIN